MNDLELRRVFHELRDAESQAAPRFAYAPPRRRPAIWRYAFVAAALIFVVVLAVRREPPRPAESIVTWKPMTDVLLRTPGSEMLTRLPEIPERK